MHVTPTAVGLLTVALLPALRIVISRSGGLPLHPVVVGSVVVLIALVALAVVLLVVASVVLFGPAAVALARILLLLHLHVLAGG